MTATATPAASVRLGSGLDGGNCNCCEAEGDSDTGDKCPGGPLGLSCDCDDREGDGNGDGDRNGEPKCCGDPSGDPSECDPGGECCCPEHCCPAELGVPATSDA